MSQCHVHLVVPSFIDGSQMFGKFFDERNEDQADKAIGDMPIDNDELNLFNKADCDDCDESNCNDESNHTFRESQFVFGAAFMRGVVLIFLEYSVVDALICTHLEVGVNSVCDDQENGRDSRDVKDFIGNNLGCGSAIGGHSSEEGCGYDESKSTEVYQQQHVHCGEVETHAVSNKSLPTSPTTSLKFSSL